MSAYFFLKHRGEYIRVTYMAGKSVAQIVPKNKATPFLSEADDWIAAHTHHLRSDWCEVENPAVPKMKTSELNFAGGVR